MVSHFALQVFYLQLYFGRFSNSKANRNLAGNYLNNKQLKIQLWDRQITLLTNTAK